MNPLANVRHTQSMQFRLHFFGAALRVREHVPEERFPFLNAYAEDVEAAGIDTASIWDDAVARWEGGTQLPLTRLASAAELDAEATHALFVVGLVEEDARFGAIFEELTGHSRPTPGLMHAWWPRSRPSLRRLAELGLVDTDGGDTPHADSPLRVAPVVWDALRGDAPGALAAWARHHSLDDLTPLDELILPDHLLEVVRRAATTLEGGAARALVVRGPAACGRRTLAGAVARASGYGLLEVSGLPQDDTRWRQVGPLATLLDALPAIALDVPPGETVDVPDLAGWTGPVAVVIGKHGAVSGPAVEHAVTFVLDVPDPASRALHWAAALGHGPPHEELAHRFRMTGGNIRRTAALARAEAALGGREHPSTEDVVRGARALQAQLLETLAARVPTETDWGRLAVQPETMRELRMLEARCRHRERLGDVLGPAAGSDLTAGVRALLTGPSGTGKTLAARTLAGVLGIDLYRIDLSTVVNKYLGETEKNLNTLFSRAEEADAALLLDEGDALLTRRTDVHTSNDRYANLETNFLLQRLESFEGILLVTTNAGDRIDDAFARRMDVVVDFALPDELERWSIWQLHLPATHRVSDALLEELAARCALSGGQMRNAVLHACLLALEDGGVIRSDQLEAAVRREYLKIGQVCPLGAEVVLG
jgi:hypothetical protein